MGFILSWVLIAMVLCSRSSFVPEEVRAGLPHERDVVNVVRISHNSSVVLACHGP